MIVTRPYKAVIEQSRTDICSRQLFHGFTRIKEDIIMSTTQPIRNKELLKKFKDFYRITEPNPRNYTIIIIGLNTALRINDILNLTYDMVYRNGKVREHIVVRERKTGKENRILLNDEVRITLIKYLPILEKTDMHRRGNPFIFPSPRSENRPLSRFQAYRMICAAAQALELGDHISCHSLRKTFGYHAWKQGNDPTVIMVIFNHSSFSITKRYLCIEQDDKDAVYSSIEL